MLHALELPLANFHALQLTSFVREGDHALSALRAVVRVFLLLFKTAPAENFSAADDLLWLSGHRQTNETEKIVRSWLHELVKLVAFQWGAGHNFLLDVSYEIQCTKATTLRIGYH